MNKNANLQFIKMHSYGNDFVVVDNRARKWQIDALLIKSMAARHRGVGFDQFMLITPGDDAFHPSLEIFNHDGSPAKACGNGTRCAGRLMMDILGSNEICFAGPAGPLEVWRETNENLNESSDIFVSMGVVRFDWQYIPLSHAQDCMAVALNLNPTDAPFAAQSCAPPIALNIGNPHLVFFCDDARKSNPEQRRQFD